MKREALGRAEKWCLAATIVCGVPLLVAPIWWQRLNADAVVSIPNPKLPSPNAYDSYVAATQQLDLASRDQLSYAVRPYQAGTPIPVMPSSAQSLAAFGPAPTQKRAYSLKEKQWLLKRNAPALQTLRKGFAFPYLQPLSRSDYEGRPFAPPAVEQDPVIYYGDFRQLGRVFILQAQLQKARGDWNGAFNSCLEGIRFGMDVPRGAALTGAFVGQSIETLVRTEAWACVPHLSASQARNAILQLQKLQKKRVPLAQTLQQQKWTMQASMLVAFRDPNWRSTLSSSDYGLPRPDLGMRTSFLSKQEIIDRIGRNLDAQIARAHLPYLRRKQGAPRKPDPLDEMLNIDYLAADAGPTRCETQSALLMTALALQAYHAQHKSYPKTLKALVPRYLPAMPLDPYSDRQPLRYKLRPLRYVSDIRQILTGRMIKNRNHFPGAPPSIPAKIPQSKPRFEYSISPYTLYSIGANGQDNGGKAIENKAATTSARDRYATYSNQRGDIVAGINVG